MPSDEATPPTGSGPVTEVAMYRLAALALVLGLAGRAAASPCDPLVEGMTGGAWAFTPDRARAAAAACEAAFIADPASQPRLGAGGSNVLGVNHRLGDLSFVLAHGRLPTSADAEAERMRLHLDLALAILSARPATRPELSARRAEILRHLAVYRDKGTVPDNLLVARRSPVFIDGADRICAVGYLIEATVGRGLAQAVAERHLVDYLGDMDYAPLLAWVAASGLTVDELALIQPAYSLPPIEYWVTFVGPLRMGVRPPDGPFTLVSSQGVTTRGAWQRGHMHGVWQRVDGSGAELGRGDFDGGQGRWSGRHPDGALAIEGEVRRDAPDGVWRAYYPSGRLAIEGELHDAVRSGTWSYYHDAPGQPLMARGRYRHTEVGAWEHYDVTGRHVATSDTKEGVVTWYDDAGVAVASEVVGTVPGTPASGVVWRGADGHKQVTRAVIDVQSEPAWSGPYGSELELRFDAAGRLATVLLRQYRGEGETLSSTDVLTIAGGRAVEAWSYTPAVEGGSAEARARVAIEGIDAKSLARLVARAEASARRHDGGPTLGGSEVISRAAGKVLASLSEAPRSDVAEVDASWVDGLRFTSLAPTLAARAPVEPLVAGCGADALDQWWPQPWACLTEPGAQIQAFVRHLPEMITSGANFVHLDELAARLLWSRLPDRVQPDVEQEQPLPAWYQLPPLSEALQANDADLFGELSSTHAPLLGRRRR